MAKSTNTRSTRSVNRIGIMLRGFEKASLPALRFMLLQLNLVQTTFEYELLPTDLSDPFIGTLLSKTPISRRQVKADAPEYVLRHAQFLKERIAAFDLRQRPPSYFILVTMARFSDNFYSTRMPGISILALGNWERRMAPPSILEFLTILTLRESVASISPSLRGSVHLGTKGCLCDFTPTLSEVRLKVLAGFICSHCRAALRRDGYPGLAEELSPILRRSWLGTSSDPASPAGITRKLGYDLFTTSGIQPTRKEKLLQMLGQEGAKQSFEIVAGIVLALLLLWLGLK